MSEPDVLAVDDLAHDYDGHPTFERVSLSVGAGEFLAVLGRSGSGKSTLLRTIAGLETPATGSVHIDGRPVCKDGRNTVAVRERGVGLVFQDYALFPSLTVRDNIAFGLEHDAAARVDELLGLIGMDALAARVPAELSGGQQQRVALARALAPRPRILLLDEPFASVDAARRESLGNELRDLLRGQGVSALLVTHDRAEALGLADRVAALVADPAQSQAPASIAQLDVPEQIYRRPASVAVAELGGCASFLPAEAKGDVASTPLGTVSLVRATHGPVSIVLRPESCAFSENVGGACEILASRFRGRGHRLVCRTPGGDVTAAWNEPAAPSHGTRGTVTVTGPCWAVTSTATRTRRS